MNKKLLSLMFGMFLLIFSLSSVSALTEPDINLQSAENVGTSSADVSAVIDYNDYNEVYVGFDYRETGSSTWQSTSFEWLDKDNLENYIERTLSGLDSNTEYEFRGVIEEYCDSGGSCFSTFITSDFTYTFTTDYEDPLIETPYIDNIGQNEATFNSQITDMGSADSLDVFFSYRESGESYTDTPIVDTISSSYTTFNYDVSGLIEGTDYEVQACAEDTSEGLTECSNSETFQTDSLTNPSISTLSPSNLGIDSVRLRGELNSLGDYSSVDIKFFYNASGIMLSIDDSETTLNSVDTYSYTLESLDYDTTYKYALGYYNTETSSWELASEKTFKTLDFSDISVNIDSATNVNESSAQLNGNINLGTYDNATASFIYRKADIGSWQTTPNQNITNSTSYNKTITGLDSNTEYEYKAQITEYCDSTGCTSEVIESGISSFTTTGIDSPSIQTLNVSSITYNSSIFNSKLTEVNEQTIKVFWQYRKQGDSSWTNTIRTDVSSPSVNDEYSQEITSLKPNIDYEVRAGVYSYELDNNYYGDIKTFTTKSPPFKNTEKKTITSAKEFEEFINNLEPDSEYEFRAVMENGNKTYYGDSETFNTELIPPQIEKDIGTLTFKYNQEKIINLENNYNYYNSYTLNIDGNNIYSSTNLTNEEDEKVLNIKFNEDKIILNSFETEKEYEAKITLTNEEGSTIDDFKIEIKAGFFEGIVDGITGIFPDSEDLSSGQKAGYVLVSMLIVTIILVAIGVTTGGVSKGILILTSVLDFLIFIFFIAIGYVSLGLLIAMIIIALAIVGFKIKGSGGE